MILQRALHWPMCFTTLVCAVRMYVATAKLKEVERGENVMVSDQEDPINSYRLLIEK